MKDQSILATLIKENEKEAKFHNLVYELVEIYYSVEKGFASLDENANTIRTLGEELNKLGGFKLMQRAHSEFSSKFDIQGAQRNLEHMFSFMLLFQNP